MDEWQEVSLGEMIHVAHGHAFKGQYFAAAGTDVLLTPRNFRPEGGLDVSPDRCKYYQGPVDERFVLKPHDIVVAMTDLKQEAPILGAAGTVPATGRYLHNQRIGKIIPKDPGRLDPAFIPWLLNSPDVRGQIRATATGATVRHSAPGRFESVVCRIPTPDTQRRITKVLAAFDELIAIADRRIWLLELLINSIYHEWFIRFRFENGYTISLKNSAIGRIPAKWNVCVLSDLAESVVRGVAPTDVEDDLPYIGLEHLPRRSTTLRHWGRPEEIVSRKLSFEPGDTLFGKIRPYFHKVVWAPFAGVASSDAIVLRARGPHRLSATLNAITSTDAFVAMAAATSNGTKMPRANADVLMNFTLALPPMDSPLLGEFEEIATTCLELAATFAVENQALAATRDLLLPRLVTGRLDISDVDLGDLLPTETMA